MNDVVVGINESKIDALILEIIEIANRVNDKFYQIEDNINDTQKYFKCSQADEFRKKFKELSSNFTNIKSNIVSISNDLIEIKKRYISSNSKTIDSTIIIKNQTSSKNE